GGDAIKTDGDLPIVDLARVETASEVVSVPVSAGARMPAGVSVPAGGRHADGTLLDQARHVIENAQDSGASNRVKRPPTVYIGYGLTVARGLVAVTTALVALAATPSLPGWGLLLVAVIVGGVGYLVLAQLTFTGRLIARLAILALSVAGILVALFGGPAAVGLEAPLWSTNLMLDIGILVSLSAGDVRGFQLRAEADRRENRAGRRGLSRR
ncbi:MAG: hypothetical protein HIU88_14210, partial [Acidobacteria bacterium]|nr:hypothetical protein [Acidobacteriota bacterium]